MWKKWIQQYRWFWAWGFFSLLATFVVWWHYPEYWELVGYYFYMVPGNSFLALPHEPVVIYIGKKFGIWFSILVAIPPTIVACYLDYIVLTPLFQRTRLGRFRNSRLYLKTLSYFRKAPFLTNVVFALSPLPFYPVRILSIASGYSRWRYSLAITLGRIPRYYFLAMFGRVLNVPDWVLGSILGLFLLLAIVKGWRKRTARLSPETASTPVQFPTHPPSLAKGQILR